jgi:hypothetical protein
MNSKTLIGSLEPKFNPFDEDYLVEILAATALAWARMKPPDPNEIEDRITERLAGRLANDPQFAELPYDIVPQYWLLGLNGERLGRLDLRFKHRNSQRDYFAFEAKRLHVKYPSGRFSTEYPTYAGANGMMAFIGGYYSKRLPVCGMLGYVMDNRPERAWTGLDTRIEARRIPLRLIAGSRLTRSNLSTTILSELRGIYLGETQHDLGSHRLRLFHLLLPLIREIASSKG